MVEVAVQVKSFSVICVYMISFHDSPDTNSNKASDSVTERDSVFGLHRLKLKHQTDKDMICSTTVDKMYLTNSRNRGLFYILLSD
jgi:hypothetical protein